MKLKNENRSDHCDLFCSAPLGYTISKKHKQVIYKFLIQFDWVSSNPDDLIIVLG